MPGTLTADYLRGFRAFLPQGTVMILRWK